MGGVLALLLALAGVDAPAAASPPAAPAVPPMYGYFEHYCLGNPGDPAKALADAVAEGWMPVPRKMMPPPAWVIESKFRIRSDATARYIMLAGRAAVPFGPETWDTTVCSVQASPADGAAIRAAFEHWVGWTGEPAENGVISYGFAEENGRRRRLEPGDPAAQRLFRSGSLRIVWIEVDGDRVSLFAASPLRPTAPVTPPRDEQLTQRDAGRGARAGV